MTRRAKSRTDALFGVPSEDPAAQERDWRRTMKGRVQPGSGSGSVHKGDFKGSPRSVQVVAGGEGPAPTRRIDFLVECKQTMHASRQVRWDELAKIAAEAAAEGRNPLLEIEFKGASRVVEAKWVLIPRTVFEIVAEAAGLELGETRK